MNCAVLVEQQENAVGVPDGGGLAPDDLREVAETLLAVDADQRVPRLDDALADARRQRLRQAQIQQREKQQHGQHEHAAERECEPDRGAAVKLVNPH